MTRLYSLGLSAALLLLTVSPLALTPAGAEGKTTAPSIATLHDTKPIKSFDAQYPEQMVVEGQTNGFDGSFTEHVVYQSESDTYSVRVWESGPGKLQTDGYPHDEYCLVLEGVLEITNADGTSREFRAGDSFVIPKGWTGIWDMKTAFRKQYVIGVKGG